MRWRTLAMVVVAAAGLRAQHGDRPGEVQKPLPPDMVIPPAPALSPEEERATFQVAPGLEVELVAAEPLLGDPVFATFDPDGRLWVVEMRGYMPDVDGRGEEVPNGRIVVLEDVDGDGRMDRSTVFLDALVLPRALALVKGGVLLIEPPYLRFWSDRDGDLEPEDDAIIATGMGGIHSPEHAANGLCRNLDNWIYLANHPLRLRQKDGEWLKEPSLGGGQWGLCQDDFGRLFYNYNSDQLRCDLIPPHYAIRNPNFGTAAGVNHQVAKDQRVRPIRVTPGINRGYQAGMLTKDGRLDKFTAACSPLVYRGDALAPEYRGNAFVCEPSAHLVKRNILEEKDGIVTARDAYTDIEFLASTDERFRPVHLLDGPDGGLYVVDMYRGVIQHRIFVTSFLRKQIEERKLESPTGLGRIWRVVPTGFKRKPLARLYKPNREELVELLCHPNGWWRDTAQRLIVERGRHDVVPALEDLVRSRAEPLARLHALWTLEGLDALDQKLATKALEDPSPALRAAAARLSARTSNGSLKEENLFNEALKLLGHKPLSVTAREEQLVRWHQALAEQDLDLLVAILTKDSGDVHIRHAAASGLKGRELEFIETMLRRWPGREAGRDRVFEGLAKCVVNEGRPERVERLLKLAAGAEWPKASLLKGLLQARPEPPAGRRRKAIRLERDPEVIDRLCEESDPETRKAATDVAALFTWPGRPGHEERVPRPLEAEEKKRFDAGRALYAVTCAGCHQPSGSGWEGLAPPLANSEWVDGPAARVTRILLHGLGGKVVVAGREYDMDMPAFGSLGDEAVAGLLTYVRRAWDNEAEPVGPGFVQAVRKATADRSAPWTAAELLKIE